MQPRAPKNFNPALVATVRKSTDAAQRTLPDAGGVRWAASFRSQ